jgi:cytochrome P450
MYNLTSEEIFKNPYPTYNKLREKHRIYEIKPGNTWVISRYDDVLHCLTDKDHFTSTDNIKLFSPEWIPESCRSDFFISCVENPEYNARRKAISSTFSLNTARILTPKITNFASAVAGSVIDQPRFDLVEGFSIPYVLKIIMYITGLQNCQKTDETKNWIRTVELLAIKEFFTEHEKSSILAIIIKQRELFVEIINEKRTSNDGSFLANLVSSKIRGMELTNTQLVNALELIIRSGFQTTAHLIPIAIVELIYHINLRTTLIESPELIPKFVEELLRLQSSFPFAIRHTRKEFNLEGTSVTLPTGARVLFSLAAANRDPRRFDNPNEYKLDRTDPHIAFGSGQHMCMGQHLTRLEISVAIEKILEHIPHMTCPAADELDWKPTMIFHALNKLPILMNKP